MRTLMKQLHSFRIESSIDLNWYTFQVTFYFLNGCTAFLNNFNHVIVPVSYPTAKCQVKKWAPGSKSNNRTVSWVPLPFLGIPFRKALCPPFSSGLYSRSISVKPDNVLGVQPNIPQLSLHYTDDVFCSHVVESWHMLISPFSSLSSFLILSSHVLSLHPLMLTSFLLAFLSLLFLTMICEAFLNVTILPLN